MKKAAIFSLLFIAMIITYSSCKNKDEEPSVKKNYAWVVGERDSTLYGLILFSDDGGENWVRQAGGSDLIKGIDISDVWAIDENNVWVVGTGNTILKSANSGETWNKITTPSVYGDALLSRISIANDGSVWICGSTTSDGFVYLTNYQGNSITICDSSFFKNTMVQGILAFDNQNAFAVGAKHTYRSDRGFVAYTSNGGQSWDTISAANNFNKWEWIGVVNSGNTIIVYGEEAHYMVSTDGGSTWKNDSVPNTGGSDGADINDLIMLDENTWWGAFDMGEIYITVDGGKTWVSQETPQIGATFLMGIGAYNKEIAISVPSASVFPPVCPIIKTSDGGATWERKLTVHTSLNKVSFIRN